MERLREGLPSTVPTLLIATLLLCGETWSTRPSGWNNVEVIEHKIGVHWVAHNLVQIYVVSPYYFQNVQHTRILVSTCVRLSMIDWTCAIWSWREAYMEGGIRGGNLLEGGVHGGGILEGGALGGRLLGGRPTWSALGLQWLFPPLAKQPASVKCIAVQTSWVVGVLLCGHLFRSLARFQVFAPSSAGSLIALLVSCGLHRGQHASPVPPQPTLLSMKHKWESNRPQKTKLETCWRVCIEPCLPWCHLVKLIPKFIFTWLFWGRHGLLKLSVRPSLSFLCGKGMFSSGLNYPYIS